MRKIYKISREEANRQAALAGITLYAAIGYVTRSARQSGWIRKKAQPETALVK